MGTANTARHKLRRHWLDDRRKLVGYRRCTYGKINAGVDRVVRQMARARAPSASIETPCWRRRYVQIGKGARRIKGEAHEHPKGKGMHSSTANFLAHLRVWQLGSMTHANETLGFPID
jgi:hypothetical protein